METLGYHHLSAEEKKFLEEFFAASNILLITDSIAGRAVGLRQKHRMSLGDALIAGTALVYQYILIGCNAEDFEWIPDLQLIDRIDPKV